MSACTGVSILICILYSLCKSSSEDANYDDNSDEEEQKEGEPLLDKGEESTLPNDEETDPTEWYIISKPNQKKLEGYI